MTKFTDKPLGVGDYENLKANNNVFTPDQEKAFAASGPSITNSFIMGEMLVCSYEEKDGATGFAMTNGKCAIHIDSTNNMIFSAGEPGQAGCGGKLVMNTGDTIQKTTAIAVEVTGKANNKTKGSKDGEKGKETDDVEEPAYSLKVYGDVLVESVGGDLKLKGDNILLNASNTLNLRSGKDINIQAGENGGKINFSAGEVKIESAFLRKKISGGEYTEGAGEVGTTQFKPGSNTTIESVGSLRHVIAGNYEIGIPKGEFRVGALYTHLNSTLDFAIDATKDLSIRATGKSKYEVLGVTTEKQVKTSNFQMIIGPTPQGASKELPAFKINSGGAIGMDALVGGFKLTSGAKALSKFSFDEKGGEWRVGTKLGYLKMDPTNVELGYIKIAKLNLSAISAELKGSAIFLN